MSVVIYIQVNTFILHEMLFAYNVVHFGHDRPQEYEYLMIEGIGKGYVGKLSLLIRIEYLWGPISCQSFLKSVNAEI